MMLRLNNFSTKVKWGQAQVTFQKLIYAVVFWCGSVALLQAAEINATLDWADQRGLGTTVTARVAAVKVKPGMQVKQGAVLLDLDSRLFKIRKQRASAMLKAARLSLTEAELEQDRAIELYDRTVLSQFDRRQADVGLAKAQAIYAQALADQQMAALDIEYSQLTAPYDAVVLAVNAAPREVIHNELEAPVLVRVARAGQMRAVAALTGDQLTRVSLGQSLEVAFRGQWQQGVVDTIQLQANDQDGKTPAYEVAVIFDVNAGRQPRAGEQSAIRLPD